MEIDDLRSMFSLVVQVRPGLGASALSGRMGQALLFLIAKTRLFFLIV